MRLIIAILFGWFALISCETIGAQQASSPAQQTIPNQTPSADQTKPTTEQKASPQTNRLTEKLSQVTQKVAASSNKYHLQYKFKPGETLRWKIEHSTSTDTRAADKSEKSRTHGVSHKLWYVKTVNDDGSAQIVYSIEDADMWHQIGDQDLIAYSSRTSKIIPELYQTTADSIGIPLATALVSTSGEVLKKTTTYRSLDLGMAEFSISFPEEPIEIGYQWTTQNDLMARLETGGQKVIKTRTVYKLSSVKDDFATIDRRVEILTPIEEPQILSQLAQHITRGVLEFDLKQGRLTKIEIKWNEKVQGFSTPDSLMAYTGEWTQVIDPISDSAKVAAASFIDGDATASKLKSPDDEPLMRQK